MKLLTLVILAAMSSDADARVKLQDDAALEQGLRTISIGKMVYKACDNISPRRIKAFGFARSLQTRARKLGYSDAEISAYLGSDSDKARVKAKARSYLQAKGADLSVPASICAVGVAEIKSGTAVGKLLRLR